MLKSTRLIQVQNSPFTSSFLFISCIPNLHSSRWFGIEWNDPVCAIFLNTSNFPARCHYSFEIFSKQTNERYIIQSVKSTMIISPSHFHTLSHTLQVCCWQFAWHHHHTQVREVVLHSLRPSLHPSIALHRLCERHQRGIASSETLPWESRPWRDVQTRGEGVWRCNWKGYCADRP